MSARTRDLSLVLPALLPAAALLLGCGGGVRRFPLKTPLTQDTDLRSIHYECAPDPADPKKTKCMPEDYDSPFAWDGANQIVFRPIARFFAVDPAGEARNVNAFDEVPDSAWFVNRIGKTPMGPDDAARGYCDEKVLDTGGPDGSWLIDQGKPNGYNPGFRVRVENIGKFMLKADPPEQVERGTGAAAIASRIYYAFGWWAPCDSVVYVRPSILKLKPGLIVTDNSGIPRPFDDAALAKVLKAGAHRGDTTRMTASRWLPGRTIGPFTYEGTRSDDPNDIIPHEDRRDLRGARVLAAWLNHFDSREQNTMNTWMADDEKNPDSSPGHIRHWYIDLGDCLGSEWAWDGISKRLGHAYYLDLPYLGEDFVTFGILQRPWDRAERSPDGKIFGYFHSRDFDPDLWRGGYPNPAFTRMGERDAAWATRIIARFTDAHVRAFVAVGDYSDPGHADFVVRHLIARRDIILRRYFSKLSPVTDLKADNDELCGVDLARKTGVFPAPDFRYAARQYAGAAFAPRASGAVRVTDEGGTCVPLTHFAADGGEADDSPGRYLVVDVTNGVAPGPLRAHLYDLGPKRGFVLVGIERPDSPSPPS